ncbi:MAG: acyl-CoA synthetase, partial [Bdellovibrionota bacterium]
VVSDRRSDLIVTGGENVYPAEVERAIESCPGVREAAVVGIPDPEWGHVVAAVVVADINCLVLEAHCRKLLAGYKVPRKWFYASELPRTSTGKISRRLAREWAEKADAAHRQSA